MKSQLHRVHAAMSGLALAACAVLISQAQAATALPPADAPQPKTAEAIPWSQIGAKAGADYKGDGLAVTRTESGARLRCVFQKLEGDATSEGLWLTSTGSDVANDRFRVVASSVGRDFGVRRQSAAATPLSDVREMIKPEEVNVRSKSGVALRFPPQSKTMPVAGDVSIDGQTMRFTRPGLVEEYTVSMDGVRQDFIIEQPPLNTLEEETFNVQHPTSNIEPRRGELRVELSVTGAKVEQAADGARLVLENSGRKIAYNRLRVTDATGRELSARMEVADKSEIKNQKSEMRLAVLVNDTDAVYPVRIDPTFSDENWISMGGIAGANSVVCAAAIDGSGNLYIGGGFTFVGNTFANNIAKWNGSSWSALGSGMNGIVYALAVVGNEVYAGGAFTIAGDRVANNIAKWGGSSWGTLGSGMNSSVLALAVSGSNVYAGGSFTMAGGSNAKYISKWDGNSWSPLGSGMNESVYALAVSGSNVYAGGKFITAGGNNANYVARWNGNSWSALGSGLGGNSNPYVYALAVSGGNLFAGGLFGTAGGVSANYVARWNGTSWSAMGSGTTHSALALAVSGSDLYAAGVAVGGGRIISKWNGSSWSGLGTGIRPSPYIPHVTALAASGTNLYAGGNFGAAGETRANNIAKWNGSSWTMVVPTPIGMNDGVLALAEMGSNVFAGGDFTAAGGGAANYVAGWNGSNWTALGAGMNKRVTALEVLGTNLYAGGEFTTAGGIAANYVAKWNGSNWAALGSGMNGVVSSLVVLNGNLYAGGAFTTAGGIPANRIAKWNGSNWSALASGMDGYVSSLAVSGGNLYAGSSFRPVGGYQVTSIARWDGVSWTPVGSFSSTLSGLAVSDTTLFMADYTVTVINMEFGKYRIDGYIRKWDGTNWFNIGYETNGYTTLAASGNNLYAGATLMTADGTLANGIAKWNPATGWSALGSGIGGYLSKIFVSGTNLYAGGRFTTAGGKVSAYLAKALIGIPPEITLHPTSRTNNAGTIASFSVSAVSDSAFGYQWIKNGSPLSDGGSVSGANTATLTLTNVLHADQGSYAAIVTNAWGSVTSAVATLTVIDPAITAQPQNQSVTVGDNAAFTVTANGTPPLEFHWLKGGTAFQTTTVSSLTLSNVQKSDEGFYSAVVSNLFGFATSESASLRVNLPPVADASATRLVHVSPNGVNATVVLDGSRSFDPDGDLLQFAWYESGVTGQLASGAVTITALPAGTHPLLLVVSDPMASRTNGVTVAVFTTAQAVERLLALVNANPSLPKSLRATLNAALASIARGNSVSAINQLQAFQNQVRAQVAPELAATLTQAAQQIIDVLNGGNAKSVGQRNSRFTDVTREANGRVRMRFSAEAGKSYLIEASTNMVDWERIGVAEPLPDGGFEFAETPRGTFERRFYRIATPGHSP